MLLAGAISVCILFGWQYVRPLLPGSAPVEKAPPAEKPGTASAEKPPAEKPGTAVAEQPPSEKPGTVGAEKPPVEKPVPPVVVTRELKVVGAADDGAEPILLGSDKAASTYDLQAEIVPRGAYVARLTLARRKFFKAVADRYLPADERAAMDLTDPDARVRLLAVPELRVKLAGSDDWCELDLSDVVWRAEAGASESQAALAVDVQTDQGEPLLVVRKVFSLAPRDPQLQDVPQYEMHMVMEFTAADERVEKVSYAVQGPGALPKEGFRGEYRQAVFGTWTGGRVTVGEVPGSKIEREEGAPADAPPKLTLGGAGAPLAWVGQVDKYFAVLLIPQKPSPEGTFAATGEAFQYKVTEHRKEVPLPMVRLVSNEEALTAGQALANDLVVFAGPKDAKHLEKYYASIGLDELIVWTRCCIPIPGLSQISRILLMVIDALQVVVRNYGLAIIVLVILLRVVMLPVSRWSARSMAEMQKMAPKMQQIREEFAHDQKRMQEEMAKIGGYKMLGGCLPMFVQMPVWIGLYGALTVAIQLRHSAFLPAAWVPDWSLFLQDLSAPDRLISWDTPWYIPGQSIPLLGWVIGGLQGMLGGGLVSFNILPILMGVVMFAQQKLMPHAQAATDQARQQQKMMAFMPIFLAVVLYNAPAGLCLYIFTSTLLGLLEHKFFRKRWVEEAKTGGDGPKAPSGEVKQKSLVSGRDKSIGERAEAWVKQRIAPSKDESGGDRKRSKPKKGRKRGR